MTIELSTLGAPIKTAYESQPDTNAFTDAEKTKLASMDQVYTSPEKAKVSAIDQVYSSAEKTKLANLATVASTGNFSDLVGTPTFIEDSRIGQNNGIAPLDASGFVPLKHLNVSGLAFKGGWNPLTNDRGLIDGVGSVGDFYKATHAGTYNTGNADYTYNVGDWIIYAAGVWQRIGSNESVVSVNGQHGEVVLNAAAVGARPDTWTPTWSQVGSKPDITNTVNGKTGAVDLAAADVKARPDTWNPSWDDVQNKPNFAALYAPKMQGQLSAPIPALRRNRTTTQEFANGTIINISGFPNGYDFFNMHKATDAFTIPAWATHARVTASMRMEHLSLDKHAWMAIRFDGSNRATGTTRGFDNITYPVVSADTGIIPVAGGEKITLAFYHNNGNIRKIFSGIDNHINVELFVAN